MEAGRLGRVGLSLLAYERWKIIPALGSRLTILDFIAALITAQVTSVDHLSFRLSILGMIGGVFLTSAFVVARGIHTGAANAITKSLVPGRDPFRSFDPSLFWSILVFWGFFLPDPPLDYISQLVSGSCHKFRSARLLTQERRRLRWWLI